MNISRGLRWTIGCAVLLLFASLLAGPGREGGLGSAEAAPLPAVPGQLRITAAGDYSSSAAAGSVLERIGAIRPDLHVAVGDLSYGLTGAEQAWCDFVTSRVGPGFPFELVAGNHESNGQNGNINDFAACLPNQLPGVIGSYGRQYYVDVPESDPIARIVVISPGIPFSDGVWDYSAGSPRYNWTASAIDGARSASIPWVVVAMHAPCLSVGQYPCTAGPAITNLLVSKKVDLVLNGHEHLYQRSKQLGAAQGCTALVPDTYTAACVRDADSDLVKGAGTVFATVGTGGVALRDVNSGDAEAGYFSAFSGLNLTPSHGLLDFTVTDTSLTAQFVPVNGQFTDRFTISPAGANTPPSALFTTSCAGLGCSFDGSGSTDPDGTIAAYAWDFGDGTTGTGAAPTHAYANAGAYSVRLTVTDNGGATATSTATVNVTAPSSLARDSFSRTVTGGLGTADAGGAWTVTGSTANYSVADGVGRLRIPSPGSGNSAALGSVSSSSTDLYLEFASDKPASGSGLYASAVGRRVPGSGEYRAKLQLTASGAATLSLVRTSATGAETTIASGISVPGVSYAVGDRLALRLRVTGLGPTTVQARAWEVGSPEPSSWLRTTTDSTAALQTPGSVGVTTYLSGTATNAPVTVLLDNLTASVP